MAFTFSIHARDGGTNPPAPQLPALGGQIGVAAETNSNDIVIKTGGGVLLINSDADALLEVKKKVPGVTFNPAASPVVVGPGRPPFFYLDRGTYVLQWKAL